MSNSRVVPPWVMVGLILSVFVGFIVLMMLPDGTSVTTTVLVTATLTTLLWVTFSIIISRSHDPGLMIELTRAQTELRRAEEKTAAPIVKTVGRLLGIKKPLESNDAIEAALAKLIADEAAATKKLNTAETRQELQGLDAERKRLIGDIESANATLRNINDRIGTARETESELTASIGRGQAESGKLSNDLGNARRELERVQSNLVKKNEELTRATDAEREKLESVERLGSEERRLTEALPGLREEASGLRTDIETLRAQQRELSSAVGTLREDQERLTTEVRDAREELQRLGDSLREKRGEFETADGRLKQLVGEIEAHGNELGQLLQDIEAFRFEAENARSDAAAATAAAGPLQAEVFALRVLERRLQRALNHLLSRYDQALATIAARDAAQTELEQARTQLNLVGQQIALRQANAMAPQTGGKVRNLSSGQGCSTCKTLRTRVTELEVEVRRLKGATSA